MGIIQRQGFKSTFVSYVGVFIGAVSTLTIYSVEKEFYGLYQFLFSTASLLLPVIIFGGSSIAVRFHPKNQKDDPAYRNLLSFLMMQVLLGILFSALLLVVLGDRVYDMLIQKDDDPLVQKYLFVAFPMACLMGLNAVLTAYISNYGRIVVPEIANRLWQKIALPILIVLVMVNVLNPDQYVVGMMAMLTVATFILVIYLFRLDRPTLAFPSFLLNPVKRKAVFSFGLFAILNEMGTQLAFNVDKVMIGTMVDLTNTGAYGILTFMVNVMLIPGGALYRIATPIVARSLVEKDMERTGDIYSRTSLVLTVLGALILGPVLINIDEIVSLLPRSQEFNGFFLIILFAGLAKWFELATSINTQIIVYSNYYRFNLVALIALGVLNVVMNYWLISKQGIVGAALATLLSLTLY
ncbi:MAG TPA: lipopolysaccharide biosynthesis protein, partial [Saprospiraceae bacterium]|nr:lipopolysaccharide biosynthesis protein [Saprospiraceae bacterium]